MEREENGDIGQKSIIKIYHWKVIGDFIKYLELDSSLQIYC